MILAADASTPMDPTDGQLLYAYATAADQNAFRELARRHLDWVYATALRMTRDSALAEDVTQGVFLALSQKAQRLSRRDHVGGWLFEAARYGAVSLLRAERRRKERERVHGRQSSITGAPLEWDDINDRLDDAVGRLGARDRQAILLRFYQRLSYEQVGAALGVSPDAARKRVDRALQRLRTLLSETRNPQTALSSMPSVVAPASILSAVFSGKMSLKALSIAKGVALMSMAKNLKIVLALCGATALTGYVAAHAWGLTPAADPQSPILIAQNGGNTVGQTFSTGNGSRSQSFTSNNGTSTFRARDDSHEVTIVTTNGNSTLTVKDLAGKLVYEGPFTTEADKAKVPAEAAGLVNSVNTNPGRMTFPGPAIIGPRTALDPDAVLRSVRSAITATDQEWSAMQDPLRRILQLKDLLAVHPPTASTVASSTEDPAVAAAAALRKVAADPSATGADINDQLEALRDKRKKLSADLAQAQKAVEDLVNLRQRAVLISLGILD